ncbi:acyltransferase [Novosphingobium sp. TH158]|uniref:acyltransferase family protein n=1 Tax=Novosphingobium sp. TH158 TaxID=2067455 RepID=UPI001304427D|nr:acyltransferase [Novosphingobium sp. TH158]
MRGIFNMAFDLARRLALPRDPGAFRLFLAMLVFVHHFSSLDWGPYAVYVFFVLSGFWVQTMWVERYARTQSPYLTYMASRVWRLAPVMVLVSLIALALLPVIGIPADVVFSSEPLHLAFSSVFLLGYAWLPYTPVGSAWSLDVEMQYYLLAPLFAWLAMRTRGWWLLVPAAAISAAAGLLMQHYVVVKYLFFFFAGLLAARNDWRPGTGLATASAASVVLAVVGILVSPWRDVLVGGTNPGPLHVHAPLFNLILGVLTIPFALYTVHRESDETDRMLADLSYIVYLLHWVAMQWFFQFAGYPFTIRLAVAATSFAVVPMMSWLIWRYYEKPINRLRARWVAGRIRR